MKIVKENYNNVSDDITTVVDVPFKLANVSYDKNKKDYEDAMKEGEKVAKEIKLGDEREKTSKPVKNKVLKSMHLSESLFTEDVDSNKVDEVRLMHQTMVSMNNEEAYDRWIYIMPDGADEYDFESFAEDNEDYIELCDVFNRLYKEYHKDGIYKPEDDVRMFCEKKDAELSLKPIEVL